VASTEEVVVTKTKVPIIAANMPCIEILPFPFGADALNLAGDSGAGSMSSA
jgi:hypothetical protein